MWHLASRFLQNSNSFRLLPSPRRLCIVELENKYSDSDKQKIIQVINESDGETISKYDITKGRLKHLSQWKKSNGSIKTLSDMHLIDGFSEKMAMKLFDSILNGPQKAEPTISNRIKGQILHPLLKPEIVESCQSVVTVHIAVSCVSWMLINKENYEVLEWKYHGIDYPDGKKLQITDILDIARTVTNKLPPADIYVMKAEATTLRAAGSDPNNPKVLAVNLQRAQMVAMIVALINARDYNSSSVNDGNDSSSDELRQKVYFLRPTLPYRLYGTLVGNERVSTDQTVDMLLESANQSSKPKTCFRMSEQLITMFRSRKDLEKDMLGHCLLLGLTFMDLCVYKNQEQIAKLLKRGES